jgi:hypothetical protein
LVIEQVLKGEPRAGQVEENLIKSSILIRFARCSVGRSAALSAEALGEHCADQLARGNSSGTRRFLDSLQELRRQSHRVWNLGHRASLHLLAAYTPYTSIIPQI